MLIHDFVDVGVPLDRVEMILANSNMGLWAEVAYRRGERLAVGPGALGVAAPVDLEVGDPVYGTDSVTIPVAWKAADAQWLFPHMEAEIVLSPLTADITHLTFQGRYTPPLNSVGAMLDRIALHRVAEATVRTFLERLADAVMEASGGVSIEVESP